ncbi:arylsulfatase B-like [Amphiura filiformis]|uniref:arylsulfatase B-like n=1 Tax=Amphiura filiformis TaxID=82378 RepID=UPI003B21E889
MVYQKNLSSTCWILLLCLLHSGVTNAGSKPKHKKFKPKQRDDSSQKPNIIFILADDLGYADVGFNGKRYGSQIQTPNLDRLARSGVILSNYYVQHLCTPSRSTLMTGRYPIHTGLSHSNIKPTRPMCLPEDEVTLPQKLKEAGYVTHMVGKWHLGIQRKECLPTYRGFDSFVGKYLGAGEYFTHMKKVILDNPLRVLNAYDFHRDTGQNRTVGYKYYGEYSTHVFAQRAKNIVKTYRSKKPLFMYLSFQAPHGPLQVPNKYKLPFANTNMTYDRKTMAAMIYCMDKAIGDIVKELKSAGMYKNTVIIFTSDNGGPRGLPVSNWPFRGYKATFFEGGVRAAGFIHTPLFPKSLRGTVHNGLIHISDWFPTIIQGLSGGNTNGTKPLDGFDMWETIKTGTKSPRTEILYNINTVGVNREGPQFLQKMESALRMGDWKIITGRQDKGHRWQAPPESKHSDIKRTEPHDKRIWLFNITADPYEFHDVSELNPGIVNVMLNRLQEYLDNMTTPIWPHMDASYDPANYGGVWGPWTVSPSSFEETLKAEKRQKPQEAREKKKKKKQLKKARKRNKKLKQQISKNTQRKQQSNKGPGA